ADLVARAKREERPHAVRDAAREQHRNDLAPKRMLRDASLEATSDAHREIALELGREIRIVRDIARDQTRGQVNLRVREHDRVLGPRQPDSGLLPLVELLFARQALELAVELRLGLEDAYQRAIFAETLRGARADDRK